MRNILFVLLALLPGFAASAEDHFGIIGGMNMANLRGAGTDAEFHGFFMGGVYADFGLDDTSYLTPQIRYIEKGAGIASSAVSGPVDVNVAFKYLELPLYYKYKFASGNNFRPNLFIGPAFALKVGDAVRATNRNTGQTASATGLFGSLIKGYDLAAEAGAGVEFMLGESTVGSFSAAYSYGLVNISKTAEKLKTQGIQFYLGLGF